MVGLLAGTPASICLRGRLEYAAFRTPHCDGRTHRNAADKRRQTLFEVNWRPGSQQGSAENLILQY